MAETIKLMEGRLLVFRRSQSRYWQCSTYLLGKERRKSTKQASLAHAKDYAEKWFLQLLGKYHGGEIKEGKTFKEAAEQFEKEYSVITKAHRSAKYVAMQSDRIRVHLLPYFGPMIVSEITPGAVQEYRIHRAQQLVKKRSPEKDANGLVQFVFVPPSRSTIHQEIVALRQILKTAHRHGWIQFIPDVSPPYKASGKISHRAWFSYEEYERLYEATRKRAKTPLNNRWRWQCEQLHDYVLFMANTGLRPDEAARLEYRDVKVVKDYPTNEYILEIEVRGKRGIGYCKSTNGAIRPFHRLRKRNNPQPTDSLFPGSFRELLNAILDELNLKFDRDGNVRTAYSLRHTYICFRLMEGADIYQIAKNCRTSVEMIEKYYASHIKNVLDAAAINVRRKRFKRQTPEPKKT